ncbi:MAG: 4-alpha-glucanotransferase [Nitrospira sp.]|jgi:4-alpha-glucanotransferase|nr:4-alpha-glucanotransferase [Nitrospira sp.]
MNIEPWGIQATYEDAAGHLQRISAEAMARIKRSMGRPPDPPLTLFDEKVKVLRQWQSLSLPGPATLTLEDGAVMTLRNRLPEDLPVGYHRLTPLDESGRSVRVIVSPEHCHLPPDFRIWGLSAQLYAARSRKSWGMGDLGDLRRLTKWAQRLGAGMFLVNPLLAAQPLVPQEASPYSPSSRRYLNPLYLRIEDLPGAAGLGRDLQRLAAAGQALNEDRHIDRDQVFRLKQEALQRLWPSFKGEPDFERFRAAEGEQLHQFALFCTLAERHGANWRQWPAAYRRPDTTEVQRFAETESERLRFHEWLQWLMNRQLASASQSVPLVQDLPVGFSPDGADAWVWQDVIAGDMTVGAPPDLYSAEGQDWGLPPFIPHRLREAAYEPFIQTIRAVLRHAGGLRIDHVMGLFRLWWVPQGRKPKDGAYVRYRADEFLAIIAVESRRAEAVVVGEDLGTVEEGVRETLAEQNVLSYRLLWFEDSPPSEYPEKALAAVTTHDLPTLAGIWTGADFEAQRQAGVKPDHSASEQFRRKLVETCGVEAGADVTVAITKTFEQLAEAPSAIVMAELEALCVVNERPNMPSATGTYPNWSLALPTPIEELESAELPRRLAHILNRRKRNP